MDFVYFFRVIFKRKWLIIGAGLLAGAIAYYLTKNEPKQYLSSAQLSTGYTIKDEIEVKDENLSFFESEAKFSNVILLFKSQAVISLLSYKLLLHDLTDPRPFRVLYADQKTAKKGPALPGKEETIRLVTDKLESMSLLSSFKPEERELLDLLEEYGYDFRSLSGNLKIARMGRTDYLDVDCLSENPELSAYSVNNLITQFLRYYTNVRDTRSLESIDTLKSIMDKKRIAVNAKRAFLTGEGAANVTLENTSSLERITNLEKNLTDEKTKQTKYYYDLRKINQRISAITTPKEAATSTEDINANGELVALKKLMNDTYEAYINGGSVDKNLLNKYNQTKSAYQAKFAEISKNATPATSNEQASGVSKAELLQQKSDIEIDIQASEANITSIQARIDALKGNVVQGASKAASVETLMKEVDLANKEYLDAKQKYTEAIDLSSSFVNNFRVILPGQPSNEPEPSKRMLIIGLSAVAVMITSILIIVLLTYLDSSIKTPNIFAKNVDLKLISMVNFIKFSKGTLMDILNENSATSKAKNTKKGLNVFRESLRKLRYEIESSGKKIFLFTSTKKGEGKTTLIQALAYSMGLSKKKILIIDTNFCNNDLTVQLRAEPILEQIDVNASEYQALIESVRNASTNVGTGTVSVIGSKGGDYTPSEVLHSGNILEHLQDLTSEYDYIFLEGPPLNDFSDSRELVKYVEGVIAIFSASHIIKQIDKESLSFFKDLNGKFTGSVLNMVEMKNVNVT